MSNIIRDEDDKRRYHGISGLTILSFIITVLFVILKLTNSISWSWIWVLSPIWISIILGFIAVVFYSLFMAILIYIINK